MPLHAALEQSDDVAVVWILGEAETAAVVHKLSELLRLITAQFVDGHFFLLFLDVRVFLLLGPSR